MNFLYKKLLNYNARTKVLLSSHKLLKMINCQNILYPVKNPIDHVVDNIYIGDLRASDDLLLLKQKGITHVINCAKNIPRFFGKELKYVDLNMMDNELQCIYIPVIRSLYFINNVKRNQKKEKQNNVLIHCKKGTSRSATIVLAYLIVYKNMTFEQALTFLKMKREKVEPNKGFVKQLNEIDKLLNE